MATFIGTSGFYYNDWAGKFYPDEVKKKDWLKYYAGHFNTVEINNSFYRLPKKTSFEKWDANTPDGFKFTLKGSRYVTHRKKLNDAKETVGNFYEAIAPMAEKTACVLWQLPGNLHFNKDKLTNFAKACSSEYINVIEFRHTSWFKEECFELLRKHNLTFCMLSAPGDLPEDTIETSDTAYLRFHGKDENNWYRYNYSKQQLNKWANKLKKLKASDTYIYFNNDYEANAIKNAQKLKELLK